MRVNIYKEELTDRVEVVPGKHFTGIRFFCELPVTVEGKAVSGPFMHGPGDDDSAGVTFWDNHDLIQLRKTLTKAVEEIDKHLRSNRHPH